MLVTIESPWVNIDFKEEHMYEGLKSLHLFTIAISAFLLSVRYILMMMDSHWLQHKFLKIYPQINDSLLLITGIWLIVITGFIPYTAAAPWMTDKITCVLAYIALGFFSLKFGRNKLLRSFAFLGAMGWLIMAGKVTASKAPMFFS